MAVRWDCVEKFELVNTEVENGDSTQSCAQSPHSLVLSHDTSKKLSPSSA